MKRALISSIYLGMILAIAVGCATVQPVTYTRLGNLSGFKEYAWLNDAPHVIGEPRTDKVIIDGQIRRQIDNELAAKGFVKTDPDKADFLIDYKLSITTQDKVLFSNEISPATQQFDQGFLSIEAVNPRTKAALWRAEQKARTYRYDFADSRMELVQRSVHDILSNFP